MSAKVTDNTPIRIDKWLWYARFFKTRSLAAKLVSAGRLRVNSQRVSKASRSVSPGDVLTFPQSRRVRVVRINAVSTRRGSAAEAQALYEDLSLTQDNVPPSPKYQGKGRPSGKDRRNIDLMKR